MVSNLKQHAKAYEKIFNSLPVAVVLFDNKGIHFINKTGRKLLKLPLSGQDKPVKFSILDLFDKTAKDKLKRSYPALLSGKLIKPTELVIRDRKNKQVSIEVVSDQVAYNGKKVVQWVFSEITVPKEKTKDEKEKELLQKVSANEQDVIFHIGFSPVMRLKFVSDSALKILGYSTASLYKNPDLLSKSIHKEDAHLFSVKKSTYLKNGKRDFKKSKVLRFEHKNGGLKYLEVDVNPVYDKHGKLLELVGNMRDITENKKTEALMLETKRKFDLITNNANEIIAFYSFKPEEKYHYVSPNIEKILGYKQKEFLSHTNFFKDRIIDRKEEFDKTDKILRSLQRKNLVRNLNFFFRTHKKSGEEVWLENNFVPITDGSGKIQFFMYIIRDITLQKEKELEIEMQYINYRNLLDNSPVAYVIHDHGVCLYVNNSLMYLFKIKNKNQIIGKFAIDFFKEGDRQKVTQQIAHIYAGKDKGKKFVSYKVLDLDGSEVDIEIKSVPIKFNNKDCILTLVNNLSEQQQREREKQKVITVEASNALLQKEIKERQEAEKNLTEKTAHLSSIFESSTHLLWTVSRDFRITSFNKNFWDVVKLYHDIEVTQGCKIDEMLKRNRESYINFWYSRYNRAFKGEKLEFEKEEYNEGKIYRKVFINPIYNEKNQIAEISCIASDITDSKIYEQKLLSQTGKLTAIFDSSHHYIWTINREEKLTSFNKNYYDLITSLYNTKPYVGLVLDRGVLANDKEYTTLLKYHYDRAFNGNAASFEIETRDKEFKNVYLEIFLNPIFENEKVMEVSGIAHNITEKKHVQQRMEVSLKEKEILLREVHHRVKNNMQVISSILNLQSSYVSDEYTLTLLKESQNRIKTMAYIHESLYQNKSFTSVNFSDYVHTLVNNIVQSYSYSGDKVKLDLNIQKMTLSLDSSIPAGLIINELITNAIKHAFPGTRKGNITFNLRCENNLVILELKDNGVGFAEGIDFENSHSLGLQLVNTLTEQIEGEIKFKSQKDVGTEVVITFKT